MDENCEKTQLLLGGAVGVGGWAHSLFVQRTLKTDRFFKPIFDQNTMYTGWIQIKVLITLQFFSSISGFFGQHSKI